MWSVTALTCFAALYFLLTLSFKVSAESTSDVVTCYYYDGGIASNNTLCPGSDSCCGITATCTSNRLCHNPGDAEGTYVRGPCAIDGWSSTCSQICLYDESGGVFPRATQCDDGSWCCNDDVSCCAHGTGVFLDATGNIASEEATVTISYPPASGTSTGRLTVTGTASSTSTSSTVSTTPSTTSSTVSSDSSASKGSGSTGVSVSSTSTAPAAATSSQDAASDSTAGSSSAMQIGLGVGLGVPLVALLSGGAVWILLRRKKTKQHNTHTELPGNSAGTSPSFPPGSSPPTADYSGTPPYLQSVYDRSAYKPSELSDHHNHQLEILAARERHELGSEYDARFELAS